MLYITSSWNVVCFVICRLLERTPTTNIFVDWLLFSISDRRYHWRHPARSRFFLDVIVLLSFSLTKTNTCIKCKQNNVETNLSLLSILQNWHSVPSALQGLQLRRELTDRYRIFRSVHTDRHSVATTCNEGGVWI